MTDEELEILAALARCSFLPGHPDKRFVKNMHFVAQHDPDRELTERQKQYLIGLRHKYRRQLPATTPMIVLAAIESKRYQYSRKVPPKPPVEKAPAQGELDITKCHSKPR